MTPIAIIMMIISFATLLSGLAIAVYIEIKNNNKK